MGVSLAALTLLACYLGPLRFGQYQLVIAFLTLVNVSDLGVATIAVRHLATTDRDPDELMGNVLDRIARQPRLNTGCRFSMNACTASL